MKFSIQDREFTINLYDTPTARAISQDLPFEANAHRWGDEIYCLTEISLEQEAGAREIMAVGEIAYWPPEHGIALFFGPTPVSRDARPRAYSACNVFGTFEVDLEVLRAVQDGEIIRFSE
ncbi:MAG: hypothetical protein JW889_11485 [Verrucomicrobia bacterium]|nr:hypothetical protein [Verrucomicrobiota bacterium]